SILIAGLCQPPARPPFPTRRSSDLQESAFDLRDIAGLCCPPGDQPPHTRLEDLAATPACRSLRLISYKDFLRTAEQVLPKGQPLDRKSTRLNSSHVKISYAVFCLKK